MDIEHIIQSFSYFGIFVLMIANGTFSFPSSQILYIIVGYFVGTGALSLVGASLSGAMGNAIGNIVLYEIVRKHGVRYIERWELFRHTDLKKVELLFKKRGMWFLFVGKLLPAVKVFVPIPAAIGKVDRRLFASVMFSASWVWSFIFIGIGYFFGKNAGLWKSYGIVLFFIAVIVVFFFYRALNSASVLSELKEDK